MSNPIHKHTLHPIFSDDGDDGDGGDGVQLHRDHVPGDDGGDAGDGLCHVPHQHVGRHAELGGASDQL